MKTRQTIFGLVLLLLLAKCNSPVQQAEMPKSTRYEDLVKLFKEWREFQRPEVKNGVPDYSTAAMKKQHEALKSWQQRLNNFDTTGWPVSHQVDWHIVRAEMNGLDFDHRVMRPWERDPAFYKTLWMDRSDVPAHEGPAHAAIIDLWKYPFPLSTENKEKLLNQFRAIAPLNEQAKVNLTGNAKDLWIAGIRDIKTQSRDLEGKLSLPGISDQADLVAVIKEAIQSTDDLATWLEQQSTSKTGPSGIGKENYTWYQKNVHLVPLTWEDEVLLLKRELARAWNGLKLEEHNNRHLPELKPADTPEAFAALCALISVALYRPINVTFLSSACTTTRARCIRTSTIGLNSPAWILSRTPVKSGASRCFTTFSIRATKVPRPRWRKCSCRPAYTMMIRACAKLYISWLLSGQRVAWVRYMPTPTR